MLISQAISLIKLYEGFRSKPYRDATGTPTIGYGSTFYENGTKVTMADSPISELKASALFNSVSSEFAKLVKSLLKTTLNDYQFGAIVSLTYNIGVGNLKKSQLLKKVNLDPNDPTIESEFMKWVNSKGKRLDGLVKRRQSEYEFYKKKSNFLTQYFNRMKAFFIKNKKIVIGALVVVGLIVSTMLYKKFKK